jgi:integrase
MELVRGLRGADIDFKRGVLRVCLRAGKYKMIGAPKTEADERELPLPGPLATAPRAWKLATPPGDLVFRTGRATVELHQNIVNRGLQPACVMARVVDGKGRTKYTGLHCVRHLYASWLIN